MSDQERRSPCRASGPSEALDDQQNSSFFTNAPSKTAVSECLSAWLHYLQVLNGLCAAGTRLSQCLIALAQEQNTQLGSSQTPGSTYSPHTSLQITTQCLSGWDELTRATMIATGTVKAHMVAALQQYMNSAAAINNLGDQFETESQRIKENCHQIICDNVLSLVNLQYQFCIACSECLGTITTCPCCQTTAGNPHDPECSMATLQQCFSRLYASQFNEPRSQTASPHSGSLPLNLSQGSLESPKNNVEMYKVGTGPCDAPHYLRGMVRGPEQSIDSPRGYGQSLDARQIGLGLERQQYSQGSGSSSDSPKSPYIHSDPMRHHYPCSDLYRGPSPTPVHPDYLRQIGNSDGVKTLEPRGPSPLSANHEPIRGPSPVQGFLDNLRAAGPLEAMRGPLPNPGILISMKAPFLKTGRSPLHYPLFPLNGQRRWSEAAAGEMGVPHSDDGTMRRWSMPWDGGRTGGSACSQQTSAPFPHMVHHRKLKPQTTMTHPPHPHSSDRSRSTTPEWQACSGTSLTSQDGLVEAIQLLSCKPGVRPPQILPTQPGPLASGLVNVSEVWSDDHTRHSDERMMRRLYHPMHSRWWMSRHSDTTSGGASGGASGGSSEGAEGEWTRPPPTSSSDSGGTLSSRSSGGAATIALISELGDNVRNYSIWSSGNDALPFLRLPESLEHSEEEVQTPT